MYGRSLREELGRLGLLGEPRTERSRSRAASMRDKEAQEGPRAGRRHSAPTWAGEVARKDRGEGRGN